MHGTAKLKVPGGKLVSVKVTYSERIEELQILGDFFIHPEASISDIERSLIGISSGTSQEAMADVIGGVAERERIEMIGVTPRAIAQAIRMAIV